MKNVSDSFQAQWQENKQQLHHILEQQERIFTNLVKQCAILEETTAAKTDFFIKDDYIRIAVEIIARKRLGQSWPCKWHSLSMLADVLTTEVGWLVSPNSLSHVFGKMGKYEKEIARRIQDLRKKMK